MSIAIRSARNATIKSFILRGKNFADFWQRRLGRSAQNYIFVSRPGSGGTMLAQQYAKSILCESALGTGEPCDRCAACRDFDRNQSWGYAQLDAQLDDFKDRISDVTKQAYEMSFSDRTVYLIEHVDLTIQSYLDPILKLMEDGQSTRELFFLFTANDINSVRRTIRSRCIDFEVQPLDEEDSRKLIAMLLPDNLAVDESIVPLIMRHTQGRPGCIEQLIDDLGIDFKGDLQPLLHLLGQDWPGYLEPSWPHVLAWGTVADISSFCRAHDAVTGLSRVQALLAYLHHCDFGARSASTTYDAFHFLEPATKNKMFEQFKKYAAMQGMMPIELWERLTLKWLGVAAIKPTGGSQFHV